MRPVIGCGFKFWLAVLLLLQLGFAQAQVYKCIQADGVVLYSDRGCTVQQATAASAEANDFADLASVASVAGVLSYLRDSRLSLLLRQVQPITLLLLLYLLMSPVCFLAYYRDKQKAIHGMQRTPESRLHFYEWLGGWPGGFLAQRLIRHKSRKESYQRQFWLIVAVHVLLLACAALFL